ncbi:MAG: hypothetical protein D3908_08450, partial [Candidatus Electrothrix sp. AUS4]|nr:hypothetical protein [Candidatus Electrothrix sp. AUS4]
SDYKKKIDCIKGKWEKKYGTEENFPFESDENKELETFVKAYERMIGDFPLYEIDSKCKIRESFFNRAIERCRILRDYDQGGAELLGCLEHKILSNDNSIEKSKLKYEQRAKEYEEYVSNAQKNYKKAMTLFTQIVKTPELNCLQKQCIKLKGGNYKCNCEKGEIEALHAEKKCNKWWKNINEHRIGSQQNLINKKNGTKKVCSSKADQENCLEDQCTLIKNCCKDMSSLDDWETSIPDYIWENLVRYEEAYYLLSKVASTVCKGKEMEDALDCWVTAFIDENKKNNHHDQFMQHAYELLKEQVAYAEKNNADRIQATIRGDANTFIGQDLYVIFQDMMKIISSINDAGKPCRLSYTTDDSCTPEDSLCIPPYDTDPYNLPCEQLKELARLDLSNKELPRPCTPYSTLPCKDPADKYCSDDERPYPCIENPQCPVEKEATAEMEHPACQESIQSEQSNSRCNC